MDYIKKINKRNSSYWSHHGTARARARSASLQRGSAGLRLVSVGRVVVIARLVADRGRAVRGRGNDAVDKRRRLSGIAQAVAVDEVGGQALQRRPLKDVHSGIEELFELLDGALRRLERAEVARDAAAHRLSGLSTAVAQEGEYLI